MSPFHILQVDPMVAPETASGASASMWKKETPEVLAVRGQNVGGSF